MPQVAAAKLSPSLSSHLPDEPAHHDASNRFHVVAAHAPGGIGHSHVDGAMGCGCGCGCGGIDEDCICGGCVAGGAVGSGFVGGVGAERQEKIAWLMSPVDPGSCAQTSTFVDPSNGANEHRGGVDGSFTSRLSVYGDLFKPFAAADPSSAAQGAEAGPIAPRQGSVLAWSAASTDTARNGRGGGTGLQSRECADPVRGIPSDSGGDGGRDFASRKDYAVAQNSQTNVLDCCQRRNDAQRKNEASRAYTSEITRHLLDEATMRANNSKLAVRAEFKTQLDMRKDSMTMAERRRHRARREAEATRSSKREYTKQLEALVKTLVKRNLEVLHENRGLLELVVAGPRGL